MTTSRTVPPTPNPYAYTPPPDDGKAHQMVTWARIGITLLLIPLAMGAFGDEYGSVPLISDINTAIHEFGHMLFMPFGIPILGHTMVIAGGAVTQIAFPLVFVGYFLFNKKHRDVHAAMICLWWVSINILDVSIYAGDARARKLMLLSGGTGMDDDSGHDFYNLFSQWGVLRRDTIYAGRMRGFAGLLCFASIAIGMWVAIKAKPPKPTSGDSDA
jgi:hypothetical protein